MWFKCHQNIFCVENILEIGCIWTLWNKTMYRHYYLIFFHCLEYISKEIFIGYCQKVCEISVIFQEISDLWSNYVSQIISIDNNYHSEQSNFNWQKNKTIIYLCLKSIFRMLLSTGVSSSICTIQKLNKLTIFFSTFFSYKVKASF